MMRDVTTDEDAGMDTLTEMDMSALNEIGNIVSGSYLNALAGLTGLKMVCSVPSLTVDMVGALLSVPATEFGKYGDKLLLIQSEFGEDDFVTGYFLLIPELDSYDKILSTLGM
jgi:chemotaxis protein CheC